MGHPAAPLSGPRRDEAAGLVAPNDNPYRGVKRFLVFASGARPEILANCATDEAAYVGLGGTVLTTSALAAVSMAFAMSSAMHAGWFVALLIALMWGAIVFNLDRWLITSQRRLGSFPKQCLAALPRLGVALLFGIVISEPLVLAIFDSEVERQVASDRAAALDEAAALRTDSAKAKQIKSNEKAIAALEADASGDPQEVKDLQSRIDKLTAETNDARSARDAAQIELEREREGISVTGKSGCGPVCQVKTETLNQKQARYNETKAANDAEISKLNGQIDKLRKQHESDLNKKRAENERERNRLSAQNTKLRAEIERDYNNIVSQTDSGLLSSIRALDHLGAENSTVKYAHWALALLLIAIDTLPVIGKLLQTLGPPKSYEVLCGAVDAALAEQAEQLREEARDSRSSRRELILADRAARARAEQDNIEYFVGLAAETQRAVGEQMLAQWRAKELTRVIDLTTTDDSAASRSTSPWARGRGASGESTTSRATRDRGFGADPRVFAGVPPTRAEPRSGDDRSSSGEGDGHRAAADRRSGHDRRVTPGIGPGGIERRRGDRRLSGSRA